MNKVKIVSMILLSVALSACDAFEYHPYDGRITGETGINAKNIARIEDACAGKTNIRFVFTGDTQRQYDDTKDMVANINKRSDIDFVIHGGDIADFGLTKEFLWMRDIMNRLSVPYVVLLGNHDCLANGEEVFRKVFGDPNFSFLAGDTKFVCLNTNALEFDYSRPVPDFNFIEEQLAEEREGHEKTIFAMHVRPYSDQFNDNVAKVFQWSIKNFKNLQFCLNAHDHSLAVTDIFNDGVIYYGSPDVKKRMYLLFTLKPGNDYDYEVVEF